MQVSHIRKLNFDEISLVPAAGLASLLGLTEQAGLKHSLSRTTEVTLNHVLKSRTLFAGILAGADSIDDFDRLRLGQHEKLIGGVRAASTVGTILCSFSHGHVLQLTKTSRGLVKQLPQMAPKMVAR